MISVTHLASVLAAAKASVKASQMGRCSDNTSSNPDAKPTAASASAPPLTRRSNQKKRKTAHGRLELEQLAQRGPQVSIASGPLSDHTVSVADPKSHKRLPSFKKRRIEGPGPVNQPDSALGAMNDAGLGCGDASTQTATPARPSEATISCSNELNPQPSVQPGPVVELTETLNSDADECSRTAMDVSASIGAGGSQAADLAGQIHPADVDVSMLEPRLEPPSEATPPEPIVKSEPSDVAIQWPSWHAPRASIPALTPALVKTESQASFFDDLNMYRFSPEVNFKPSVASALEAVGVHVDAPARSVPATATAPERPSLKEHGLRPLIWAQVSKYPPLLFRVTEPSVKNRQELCEVTDYFRSYQGGVYFSNDQVYGYLLGGFPSKCGLLSSVAI